MRKKKIDHDAELKRQQKEEAKMNEAAYGARRVYRGHHRGNIDEDEEM